MSELMDDLERAKFSMFLAKVVRQRPEHIASSLKRHPHCHGYIFVHLYKWDSIPSHFREVVFQIVRHGPRVDYSTLGEYVITLHGRGKGYQQFDKRKTQYIAGCKLFVSIDKGIQVKDVKCHVDAFKWLLITAKRYDRSPATDDEDKLRKTAPTKRKSFECGPTSFL
jgi:hypothetical protein